MQRKIRVLVADDSALMRRTLQHVIESHPDFEMIGYARDGEDAVVKARDLKPDVVTMDINMPKMDGISAMQMIVNEDICPVVMLSSLTQSGAVTTFECMELGAFDYVGKPDGTVSSDLTSVAHELLLKLKAAAGVGALQRTGRGRQARRRALSEEEPIRVAHGPSGGESVGNGSDFKAVVIGISTGGPGTIMEVLPLLPSEMNAAVFLIQHMPPTFTNSYAKRLNQACKLEVAEVESGVEVRPGHCYVGRGDYHLTLFRKASGQVVVRTALTPRTLFVPSVDVTMESVLSVYGKNTIGVLMTGIGDDGANQMVRIRQAGGHTIAESEESSVVFGMPREAIERGGACEVFPSWEIAKAIVNSLGAKR